jgi:phospholipid transport system substrate-binding protein
VRLPPRPSAAANKLRGAPIASYGVAVRRLRRRFTALTAVVLASSLVASTVAPPPALAGAPTDAMRDFFAAVNVVLTDPRTEDQPLERLRAIRRLVDEAFDFREAAMLALGREWSARTAVEQNEFVALFADLLERSFVWRVAGKAALSGGVKVHYVGETVEGDVATVDTAVTARDGNDLRLEYRMVRRAERWVVRDVVMDGVSTMENYHAQFQRVVRDSSWRDLMAQLRAKVGAPAVQVAAPTPTAPSRSNAMVVGPVPPELDGPIPEERRSIARDVAAVVTPGLAGRDVPSAPPVRQPSATTRERRVAPAPPPTGPVPSAVTAAPPPAPIPAADSPRPTRTIDATPPADIATPRPTRSRDGSQARVIEPLRVTRTAAAVATVPSVKTVAATSASAERPQASKRGVARAAERRPAYWVQVGAYRSPAIAGKVAKQVKGEILVARTTAAGDPLLRVRVGPFSNRAQATARLQEYQSLGYKPFVATD